jgi:hypothetical protein
MNHFLLLLLLLQLILLLYCAKQAGIAGDGLVLPVERMNKYGVPGFVLGVVEVSSCRTCNCLLL